MQTVEADRRNFSDLLLKTGLQTGSGSGPGSGPGSGNRSLKAETRGKKPTFQLGPSGREWMELGRYVN